MAVTTSGTGATARTAQRYRAALRSGWLQGLGGLLGGFVAAGLAGTSTKTLHLGAVWLGALGGVLIVVSVTALATRSYASSPPAIYRQQFRSALKVTVGWALGAFVLWFLIVQPLLLHVRIDVPMFL